MGNYRFKFVDILPNSWFPKLKEMSRRHKSQSRVKREGKPSPNNQKPFPNVKSSTSRDEDLLSDGNSRFSPNRVDAESFHVSRLHPQEPPRRSRKRNGRKPISPKAKLVSWREEPILPRDDDVEALIDAARNLKPILTKPNKTQNVHEAATIRKKVTSTAGISPTGIRRLRMRANSPRVATKKVLPARKTVLEKDRGLPRSFAMVKSSSNPEKDFRDSMVEMIEENNIRASKDLEELLACYLFLNSNEYHGVIIKVFEEILFDLTHIRL
ncbi:hypothetical protein HPP92_019058 [Vanilla planifolia]|uniref:Transcription repressor n=1 Tax=Vanilla planifolia TaxID=51239 RepID=A0A835QES9_VANPL|nr:hypothetical protein HPP92_019058 [Vanilla planifolia]